MREPTTKDLAEYFRLVLEAGLCREDEVENWADSIIVKTGSPLPDWLLNLSVERETSKNKLLQVVPGEADELTAWSLVLAQLGVADRAQELSREKILCLLNRWALDCEIPNPFCKAIYKLDYSFDGMMEGWHSENQFIKDFEDFFEQFRAFELFLPQPTLKALQ
jgi:hypothetical protein